MIHEDEFAAIGKGFFKRRELARFEAVNLSSWFLVLGAWLFVGGVCLDDE